MLPIVSVLIPCYNHEKYITDCLNSLYESDYKNIELVIIDDGSLDNSFHIIKQWVKTHKKRFVKCIVSTQTNKGLCKTLNLLVKQSSGDYCILLASDDYLLPGSIESRLKKLQESDKYLAVFGTAILVDENKNILSDDYIINNGRVNKAALLDDRFITDEIILRWAIPGPVFMARREAYDETLGVGLYDETLTGEDRDFYLRLLARNALCYIDQPVAAWRIVTESLSRSMSRRKHVLPYWYQTDRKNLQNFSGLSKLYLFLIMIRIKAEIRYLNNQNKLNDFIHFLTRAVSRIAYSFHSMRIYLLK